jgi:hypothetical protein
MEEKDTTNTKTARTKMINMKHMKFNHTKGHHNIKIGVHSSNNEISTAAVPI